MKTLFDTTRLGSMSLKNRFIRAAVHEKLSQNKIDDAVLYSYKKLAQGGVGTIITGFTLVDEAEKSFPLMAIYDDSFLDAHKNLVETVHEYNANIVLQLVYVGSYVMGAVGDAAILAPSAVENRNTKVMPEEITVEQIKNIQAKFAEAVLRAKIAGYDGVEIHAAHGFLLSQFMTPYYNRRTDLYGGSAKNRTRMTLETCDGIREAVGGDFPIWVKINVTDGINDGVAFDDVLYLCGKLAKRKIDAIEISGAWQNLPKEATSYFRKEAEMIAANHSVKVILTGGNVNFREMKEILETTEVEYFGMARALIKEPDLINQFAKEVGVAPCN
ncbi:NADH:flavin oxidoreductase [Lachnospiraceae bacterium ZAX-1]